MDLTVRLVRAMESRRDVLDEDEVFESAEVGAKEPLMKGGEAGTYGNSSVPCCETVTGDVMGVGPVLE